MVLGIGSPTPPTSRNETPSTGINWKLFLLAAGIIGVIALAIGMMGGDNSATKLADTNAHSVDIGQGSGPGSLPVAVETETPKREIPELTGTEEIGYIGTYYPVDNIPKVLKAARGDLSHTGFQDIYFTNLRRENGRFKFCVENRGSYNGDIGTVCVRIDYAGGGLLVDTFANIIVSPGKKKCFVTRDIDALLKEPSDAVMLRMVHSVKGR